MTTISRSITVDEDSNLIVVAIAYAPSGTEVSLQIDGNSKAEPKALVSSQSAGSQSVVVATFPVVAGDYTISMVAENADPTKAYLWIMEAEYDISVDTTSTTSYSRST